MPDPQENSAGTPAGGIDLSGLRTRTIQQAKSELPQPQLAPPWEDEPRLQSAPTSKLGKAYAEVKQWFSDHEQHVSEKYLAPFREGLDRLGEDLQQAGESGHTPTRGALAGPTRALVSGVGTLLKQVPVGRDIKSTALALATPPELPEGKVLSRELNAWERTGKEVGTVYHGGKTTVGEVDPSKLQQRDAGFYGPGFYVTKNEQYAKTYGNKVSQKAFNPDAKILDVGTIHPGYERKVNPELQKEIEATQRAYLTGLPKAQKNPNLVNDYLELIDPKSKSFDLHSWIDAVNRHAEQKGYDAIRFSDGEIVVKNPKALATDLSGLRTRPVQKRPANPKDLPAQPRLPDTGTHAAIKTDDGGIYPDLNPEKQRTHIMLAKDLGIPPERVVSGGWLKDGEYEGSERSDAGRWGEQARAQAAVAKKRTASSSEGEQPAFFHGTGPDFKGFTEEGGRDSATGNPTGALGTFFTKLPEEANRYVKDFHGGKGKVIEAGVSLQKPYEMSLAEFNSLTTPKDWSTVNDFKEFWKDSKEKVKALRKDLESKGYDGIVIGKGGKYEETVVFDPQNIKTKSVRDVAPGITKEPPASVQPSPSDKARERELNLKTLGIGLTEMDPADAKNWVGYTNQQSLKIYRGVDDPSHAIEAGDYVTTSKESAQNYGKHVQELEVSPAELRYVRGHKDGDPLKLDQGGQTELIYAPKAGKKVHPQSEPQDKAERRAGVGGYSGDSPTESQFVQKVIQGAKDTEPWAPADMGDGGKAWLDKDGKYIPQDKEHQDIAENFWNRRIRIGNLEGKGPLLVHAEGAPSEAQRKAIAADIKKQGGAIYDLKKDGNNVTGEAKTVGDFLRAIDSTWKPETATKIDLSGLRVRLVKAGRQVAGMDTFIASDGRKYQFPSSDATWEKILKVDPRAKRIK